MADLNYDEMIAHCESQIEKIKELDIYETENERLLAMDYYNHLIKNIKYLKDYKPKE